MVQVKEANESVSVAFSGSLTDTLRVVYCVTLCRVCVCVCVRACECKNFITLQHRNTVLVDFQRQA